MRIGAIEWKHGMFEPEATSKAPLSALTGGKCLLTRVTAQWPVCDRCNGSPLPGHTDDGRLTAGLYLGFNFQTATASGCGARGWVCMTLARVTMSALSPEMNGTDPPWIRNTSPSALYL